MAPMTEFAVSDVQESKMMYVQSQHRHQEPVQDSFLFHVSDSTNDSPVLRFNITIQVKVTVLTTNKAYRN